VSIATLHETVLGNILLGFARFDILLDSGTTTMVPLLCWQIRKLENDGNSEDGAETPEDHWSTV
jgi:hypothetical protein